MSTITKERIELFIKSPLENGLTRGEQMELARIALASLEAEKVTLYRERNPYNGMTTGWQELTEQEYEFVKDNASENAEFRTVYTAPPAPVIQADVAQAIENLKQKSVECNRYNYCADAVKGVEDACLAAMRHGPEPVSQTYNLPELIEGMEVSIDVSTCDADLGNRYFGTVTEALELDTAKNGYILLVQDAEPNFDVNGNSPGTPDSWIICSDRMPEKGQNVLISVNFDSSLVEPLICSARYTGSTFRRGDATIKPGNGIEQATHWMPLPEPPQEVNRG
ncbi:TPA: DUF551 domain-containing protein [Escherichia coli]|nr:DUF551 domain-containing protein [Escherichia coli]EIG5428444.1 DUF551 domain-containing protein [Escherichia coli]EJY9730311.1 DUF551 domain-containing protein [Escherichia coli]HBA9175791.1 DUF551 domain-containing protein [Escherichia coli]HBB8665372.1 DUF551 domain-containing protein [Escherichia coli]